MFDSVSFSEMQRWLGIGNAARKVDTLGRRSFILAGCPDAHTIRIEGSHGAVMNMDKDYWNYVCKVIHNTAIDRREKTTTYSQLRNYRFSPSVPALCRAYYEEKGGVR